MYMVTKTFVLTHDPRLMAETERVGLTVESKWSQWDFFVCHPAHDYFSPRHISAADQRIM